MKIFEKRTGSNYDFFDKNQLLLTINRNTGHVPEGISSCGVVICNVDVMGISTPDTYERIAGLSASGSDSSSYSCAYRDDKRRREAGFVSLLCEKPLARELEFLVILTS